MKYLHLILFFINFLNILWFKIGKVNGIVGGKDAKVNQFMYHISLLINNTFACGGFILNSQHVISAAQCIIGKDGEFLHGKFSILAGVNYLDSKRGSKTKREVIKAYVPYEFRKCNSKPTSDCEAGDITVLKLESPLHLGPNSVLKHLILPKKVNGIYRKFKLRKANFTGFGIETPTYYNSENNVRNLLIRHNSYKKLKYAEAAVENGPLCQTIYPWVQEAHLCVRLQGSKEEAPVGACHGDIGGPLVVDEITVIGILTKFYKYCDETYYPSVYTRVSSFAHFIDSVIRGESEPYMRIANYIDSDVVEIIHPEQIFDVTLQNRLNRN